MELTLEQIYNLKDMGYTLEDFFYVYYSFNQDERYIAFKPNLSLVHMGKLTAKGFKLLEIVDPKKNNTTKLSSEEKKEFEKLWNVYPIDNGTNKFSATRLTRGNKELAQKYFRLLLNEYTSTYIINLTVKYIDKLIKASNTKNELEYLPNLSRFLQEKRFLEVAEDNLTDRLIKPEGGNDSTLL